MDAIYEHRQVGWAMIIIFVIVITADLTSITFLIARLDEEGMITAVLALLAGALVLAGLLVCFRTLTVRITPEKLTLWYGPGIIRKTVLVSSIASASPVMNKWWYGLGVRITRYGWLYNVSGLKAVEIHTWKGGSVRIGTDEPEALCHAIEQARAVCPAA